MPNYPKGFESTKREGDGAPVRFAAVIALGVSLALSSSLLAAADNEDAAPETPVASADDAEGIVGGMIEEWLQEGPGRAIRERDNLNVVQGTSLVPVKADNQRWGKGTVSDISERVRPGNGEVHRVGPAADFRQRDAGLLRGGHPRE